MRQVHFQSSEFVHFPERVGVVATLLRLARGEGEPMLAVLPAETGGGKSTLIEYVTNGAGLPELSSIGILMGTYGPENLLRQLAEKMRVGPWEKPMSPEEWLRSPPFLPVDEAVPLLDATFSRGRTKLVFIDDAHNANRQQSPAARQWIERYLQRLVQRHRVSVVLLPVTEYDGLEPVFPRLAPTQLRLGTVGDSRELRTWLDVLQDSYAGGESAPTSGRLSDDRMVTHLLESSFGMLGFIEDEAKLLLTGMGLEESTLPGSLQDRVGHPKSKTLFVGGPPNFRKRVYAGLRRAYDQQN